MPQALLISCEKAHTNPRAIISPYSASSEDHLGQGHTVWIFAFPTHKSYSSIVLPPTCTR